MIIRRLLDDFEFSFLKGLGMMKNLKYFVVSFISLVLIRSKLKTFLVEMLKLKRDLLIYYAPESISFLFKQFQLFILGQLIFIF